MTSVDIQLQRDKTGSLPFLSNWSRYEPAGLNRVPKGNTDHWSKTKHKNVTPFTTGSDGQTHFYPGERCPHEIPPHEASTYITPHHKIDGKMKNIGTKSFTELLLHELNGNMPGNYYKTRKVPRHVIRTAANERARDGYEYWWHETKPVNHGKFLFKYFNIMCGQTRLQRFLSFFDYWASRDVKIEKKRWGRVWYVNNSTTNKQIWTFVMSGTSHTSNEEVDWKWRVRSWDEEKIKCMQQPRYQKGEEALGTSKK